jgi:anti-sigma regulatory factor (Ser/Thr protein kinase)
MCSSDARRIEIELIADATAAGRARHVVGRAAAGLPGDLGFRARLAASELVSNSVAHAIDRSDPLVRLAVSRTATGLRVEVRDSGAAYDSEVRHVTTDATSGRGLRLVDVLVDRWEAEHDDEGNLVWFEIDQPAGGDSVAPDRPSSAANRDCHGRNELGSSPRDSNPTRPGIGRKPVASTTIGGM